MPINASPHYERAEIEYLKAETTEQKIRCLKKMLTLAPKHKGAENLLKQLRTRLRKLKYTKEKESKKHGATKKGIKKESMQAIIIGKTNSGKSSLLQILTNTNPKISENLFTTTEPAIGMMNYATANMQIIENPAIGSEYYDKGLTNTADTILILTRNLEDIDELQKQIQNSSSKKILVINLDKKTLESELRKINARLNAKRYKSYVIICIQNNFGIEDLREKIFQSFDKIRIYTKEPGKEKTKKPIILNPESTIKDAAEKILKGFSEKIKQTKIWGPSSKFPGQSVGLKHKLKDLDVVEFKTK